MKVNFYILLKMVARPQEFMLSMDLDRDILSLKPTAKNTMVTRPPDWHLAQTEKRCMRAFKIVDAKFQEALIVDASWNSGATMEGHLTDLP